MSRLQARRSQIRGLQTAIDLILNYYQTDSNPIMVIRTKLKNQKNSRQTILMYGFLIFLSISIVVAVIQIQKPKKLITGRAAPIYTGNYTNGLTVSENGAIVENANITNGSGGVCLIITGDNVTIRNVKVHDCQDHGVMFKGTNGGIIENSEIWRAAMRNPPNSVQSGWPSLMKVQSIDETSTGLAQNIIIRNNYIHEGYGECMGLRGSHILVTGNHIKDCYSIGIYSNSDNTTVENNFVECTGNPEFNRSGEPMVGIGFAEESFSNWGAHGHDTQKVVNNIVTGCKYGVRYGSSTNGKGLSNSIIAFNTLNKTTNTPISISYYSSQTNDLIENNIASAVTANSAGMTIIGNLAHTFTNSSVPTDFILSSPLPALGTYTISTDFFNHNRISPADTGAIEYGSSTITVTPVPTSFHTPTPVSGQKPGDVDGNGSVNILDFQLLSNTFGKTSGQAGYDVRADFDGSNTITILDFQILSNNFGR